MKYNISNQFLPVFKYIVSTNVRKPANQNTVSIIYLVLIGRFLNYVSESRTRTFYDSKLAHCYRLIRK